MKEKDHRGEKVLITGGLGMIGSSIAIRLRQLGADITILDTELPMYGANGFNLEPIKDHVVIIKAHTWDCPKAERADWNSFSRYPLLAIRFFFASGKHILSPNA